MRDLYVDTPESLVALCRELGPEGWFALDTEFVRERTYFPRLCLIQVADSALTACVDVLALPDLDPLLELIYDAGKTKVFHAAQQDLEVLQQLRGEPPPTVFDTQIAAAVLGHPEQVGYANLVKTLLGLQLDKTQTRTDWSRRPLKPEQQRYAADDVRYLCQVFLILRKDLIERDRWQWLEADMKALSNPERYRVRPDDAWQKVKRHNGLRSTELLTLQRLAAWREREAATRNQPRRWVLADDVLLELARRRTDSLQALSQLRGLSDSQFKLYGRALLQQVAGTAATTNAAPPPIARRRLNPEQETQVDALMNLIRDKARDNDVGPGILANRREIEKAVVGDRDLPLFSGWRAHLAGQAVLAYLAGDTASQVDDGEFEGEQAHSTPPRRGEGT